MTTTIGKGSTERALMNDEVRQIVANATRHMDTAGKKVLVIIPDATRTCPLPQISRELHAAVSPEAKQMDFLIALGTHPAMSEEQIDKLVGCEPGRREEGFGRSRFINHAWDNPDALVSIGTITADQVREISPPEMEPFAIDIDVTINRLVLEYDQVLICGPVFPHEVVGFSGGAKYFFPGICGPGLLNFFHWQGAVISCPRIIGNKYTPVRNLLHVAADMVPTEAFALCMVVTGGNLAGLYFGDVKSAWSEAADLSDKLHIRYVDKPFTSVLSRAPQMYDELWVGAKCMYKMEPVVADGGELIIYAPHLDEISVTHGTLIEKIGYHTRDYFLREWEQFKHYPWGVIAHSTHVRGIGGYENGVEKPRITVTLATGIPQEVCERVNLGYRDPASIDPAEWEDDPDRLYVPKAGEMLYKLKDAPAWQRAD